MAVAAIGAAASWFFAQPRATIVQTTPIVTVYPSQQFVVLNSSGYVVAQRKAAIASKATRPPRMAGRRRRLARQGGRGHRAARQPRRRRAGGERTRRRSRAARAALEQAKAEDRDAATSLKRDQDLFAKSFVSEAAIDTAKMRADRARAGVANATASIGVAEANARNAQVGVDYTLIRAPFDGVILSKNANVGDIITPFSSAADSKGAVVTMADMSTLEVEADVSESSLAKISRRAAGRDHARRAARHALRGRISRIVPTVDRAKATVMTKVRFDEIDPRVLPEMSAKVCVPVARGDSRTSRSRASR